jgi:ell wall binding domain 2 (CWB2)
MTPLGSASARWPPPAASGALASVPAVPSIPAAISKRPYPRRLPRPSTAALVPAAAIVLALAGCGKSALEQPGGGSPTAGAAQVTGAGAAAAATRNTTRLGGADPIADAAAVALAAYPGLTAATRPQAVVLAGVHDWPAALAASSLASAPLGAPLLYADDDGGLSPASERALQALHPTGASVLGGAQLILLGSSIDTPAGYRARGTSAGDPYSLAASVAKLLALARGTSPRQVIVAAADGPPALAMPAAGLAAQSGAPILFVTSARVPTATATELRSLGRPAIYAVGSTAIGERVLDQLHRYGNVVKRVEVRPGEDVTPAGNAIAVSRFIDGSFGWGVSEPGHGLAFADTTRPFDAPAAAILSATGDYAPLLLLEGATGTIPPLLSSYLSNIQPAAPQSQPVRGVYNHGWLIGDERAISATTQAELDAALEIEPHATSSEESSSLPVE